MAGVESIRESEGIPMAPGGLCMAVRMGLLTLTMLAVRCGADGGYFFQDLQSGGLGLPAGPARVS